MAETFVTKVTLSSKKIVLLREPKIKDQELAAKAAASQVGENSNTALAMAMQKEMLKMLTVQIDGKDVKPVQLEDLDSVFNYRDYSELSKVVQQLMGYDGKDEGNVKVELTKHGS